MGPFAGMAVAGLVLATGTGIALTALVARGAEVLAYAMRSRYPRPAGARPWHVRDGWRLEQGGMIPQ